jgi:hypothetical protein
MVAFADLFMSRLRLIVERAAVKSTRVDLPGSAT